MDFWEHLTLCVWRKIYRSQWGVRFLRLSKLYSCVRCYIVCWKSTTISDEANVDSGLFQNIFACVRYVWNCIVAFCSFMDSFYFSGHFFMAGVHSGCHPFLVGHHFCYLLLWVVTSAPICSWPWFLCCHFSVVSFICVICLEIIFNLFSWLHASFKTESSLSMESVI